MPGFPWEPHTPGEISVGQLHAPQDRAGTGAGTPGPCSPHTLRLQMGEESQ